MLASDIILQMAFQYSLMEKFYDWVGIDAGKNSCFFAPSEIVNIILNVYKGMDRNTVSQFLVNQSRTKQIAHFPTGRNP